MKNKKNIEAIYPLSPMQQGMLFHTLYEPQSAMYFEQFSFLMHGQIDGDLLKQAWQTVVNHHSILRTAFVWKGQEKPLQVVFKQATLPWEVLDWRALTPEAQAEELTVYLQQQRKQGFNLAKPPLAHGTLIHLADDSYRFIWSNHHILLDGWSLPLLLKEVFICYETLKQKQTPNLAPTRPYRDYITWIQEQDPAQAEDFWRNNLAEFTAPTPLIALIGQQRQRKTQKAVYDEKVFSLTTQTTTHIQALARQHQLTLNTIFQGAWAILLQRYTGRNDVLFGVTVSGRPPELDNVETMVGLFINSLPLRLKTSSQTSLIDMLQIVQNQQLTIQPYSYTPLAKIQEWSELEAGTALFESLFVFENYPLDAVRQRDAKLSFSLSDFKAEERTNYPLTIVIRPGEAFKIQLIYDTNLFEVEIIDRLFQHLQTLLANFSAFATQPISNLPLLTEQEQQQVLYQWNKTQVDYDNKNYAHILFAERAAQQPDAIALVKGDKKLTYSTLDQRSNQLARILQNMGVGLEVTVVLYFDRSFELVIAALSVLKAGGIYVPIDAALPTGRLALVLENTQATVVLTTTKHKKRLPKTTASVLYLDIMDDTLDATDANAIPSLTAFENLAYIIYTSGSTGRPKGVAISHTSLSNLIASHQESHHITPADRMTMLASPAFDASVLDIWPYLTAGASIHIPDDDTRINPPDLVAWFAKEKITHTFLPTPLAEATLAQPWPENIPFKYLITGGDRLRQGLRSAVSFQLINIYGPTEDTVYTTCISVGQETLPPIGRPTANKQVYVLDQNLAPVPAGIPGELYIGGLGLALGYFKQPTLTASSFIPDPFSNTPGSRLYKTGDLVRYRHDGVLEFLDRIDKQVQVHGFRIELGEIEVVLTQHPAVREAVAIVWESRTGGKQILAYFTAARKPPPSLRELERYLKRQLPDYMIPKSFFILDQIPLTSNGKIDRKALPLPETSIKEDDLVAPTSQIEQQLVEIWSQVLGVEKIGIENNFFELGGDSVLSIQLVARAAQAGLHISVKQIFQYPTIAQLAPYVSTTTAVKADQAAITGDVPLTPIQHWFFEQELPQPHHFNQVFLLVERKAMDPTLVEEAINHLVTHHDALRMRYQHTADGWTQMIMNLGEAVPFSTVDLSEIPTDQLQTTIKKIADEVCLNLSSGLLLHCVWFNLGPERPAQFLWILHHLVVDGLSWRILFEDLQTAYHQLRQGRKPNLPAKTTSYKYWAERLREYVKNDDLTIAQNYWLNLLKQPIGSLPVDYLVEADANTEGSMKEVKVSLSPIETKQLLQDVPKIFKTEINDVLLTALVQALSDWTDSTALLIDLEGHGRAELFEDVDLSRTVGWFTSIYPVCLKLHQTTTIEDALKTVKEHLRQIPNQGMSYGWLRYLSDNADLTANLKQLPRAQLRFNYMGQYDQGFGDDALFIPAQEFDGTSVSLTAPRSHLLDIGGGIVREQLSLSWMYSGAVHKEETIKQVANNFIVKLQQIIAHSQRANAPIFTPSDFESAGLDQSQLDQFISSIQGENA